MVSLLGSLSCHEEKAVKVVHYLLICSFYPRRYLLLKHGKIIQFVVFVDLQMAPVIFTVI